MLEHCRMPRQPIKLESGNPWPNCGRPDSSDRHVQEHAPHAVPQPLSGRLERSSRTTALVLTSSIAVYSRERFFMEPPVGQLRASRNRLSAASQASRNRRSVNSQARRKRLSANMRSSLARAFSWRTSTGSQSMPSARERYGPAPEAPKSLNVSLTVRLVYHPEGSDAKISHFQRVPPPRARIFHSATGHRHR